MIDPYINFGIFRYVSYGDQKCIKYYMKQGWK